MRREAEQRPPADHRTGPASVEAAFRPSVPSTDRQLPMPLVLAAGLRMPGTRSQSPPERCYLREGISGSRLLAGPGHRRLRHASVAPRHVRISVPGPPGKQENPPESLLPVKDRILSRS